MHVKWVLQGVNDKKGDSKRERMNNTEGEIGEGEEGHNNCLFMAIVAKIHGYWKAANEMYFELA